jgi:hypothetical protein
VGSGNLSSTAGVRYCLSLPCFPAPIMHTLNTATLYPHSLPQAIPPVTPPLPPICHRRLPWPSS